MDKEQAKHFTVTQFANLESALGECLEFIPYVDANRAVVSPRFIPIIMESCSLIDSIFCELLSDGRSKNVRIYSEELETRIWLNDKISLFLNTPVYLLNPFAEWQKNAPRWWTAHNKIKHDRINSLGFATFENAVEALCALHQVIASCKMFVGPCLKRGWINTSDADLLAGLGSVANLGALTPSPPPMAVESVLFVSPSRDNFIASEARSNYPYIDIDYGSARDLSDRVRNFIFAHEEFQ